MMDNGPTLRYIAQHNKKPDARITAIEQLLLDDSVLCSIAKNDPEPLVRIAAVSRLTEGAAGTILKLIAAHDPDTRVRTAAAGRLKT